MKCLCLFNQYSGTQSYEAIDQSLFWSKRLSPNRGGGATFSYSGIESRVFIVEHCVHGSTIWWGHAPGMLDTTLETLGKLYSLQSNSHSISFSGRIKLVSNIFHSTTFFIPQHFSYYNIFHSTTFFIPQHFSFYITVVSIYRRQ